MLLTLPRISIVTGHYGSGKTNFAVNLALFLRKQHDRVAVVDLDIVNPYFRTADFSDLFSENDIQIIAPIYANTNLDIPALPATIHRVFDDPDIHVVIDVGGDDAGAIALGQYAPKIKASDYGMFYVINEKRYLTKSPAQAVELLREMEAVSRVSATAIVNNTNLGELTTRELVLKSADYAKAVCAETGLPLLCHCMEEKFVLDDGPEIMPIRIFVKKPWEEMN